MTEPISIGRAAPAFSLPDQQDQPHQLEDYRGQWVVLYFYPKDSTPGCTKEACGFRDAAGPLKAAGAAVLGVSPDGVKSHAKFAEKQSLNFSLLADEDQKVCTKYGVWQEKSMYGKTYMGVVRTTYLIDPAGKVAERWIKVKVPGHVEAVLSRLGELSGKR
ncbi:MAG: thioredoxin-dependent thiol peroxidase [Planctomycetota bacterium]